MEEIEILDLVPKHVVSPRWVMDPKPLIRYPSGRRKTDATLSSVLIRESRFGLFLAQRGFGVLSIVGVSRCGCYASCNGYNLSTGIAADVGNGCVVKVVLWLAARNEKLAGRVLIPVEFVTVTYAKIPFGERYESIFSVFLAI